MASSPNSQGPNWTLLCSARQPLYTYNEVTGESKLDRDILSLKLNKLNKQRGSKRPATSYPLGTPLLLGQHRRKRMDPAEYTPEIALCIDVLRENEAVVFAQARRAATMEDGDVTNDENEMDDGFGRRNA